MPLKILTPSGPITPKSPAKPYPPRPKKRGV
jgi:hypothetical protein